MRHSPVRVEYKYLLVRTRRPHVLLKHLPFALRYVVGRMEHLESTRSASHALATVISRTRRLLIGLEVSNFRLTL